ncbi:MAG TPA: hypothetical protein VFW11_10055 [Cyclobacteriaceae bacterium]|nr:hypothetical protein [Cyclobacteriaceae bacterium]
MKSNIKLALAALVLALASCTSKPAENTATESTDSVATETPAPVEAAPDTTATPADSAAAQ